MARSTMASLPLTVLLAFGLCFAVVSTLTDEQREKLDEIEKLLQRLQNELNHMRNADNTRHMTKMPSVKNSTDDKFINGSNNNNKTETSFNTTANSTNEDYDFRNLTTPLENKTTPNMEVDLYTTIPDLTSKLLDSVTNSSDLISNIRDGPKLTTEPSHATHQESFESTGTPRPWFTQTKGMRHTTEKENKVKDDKNKEGKDKGEKEEKDREEENELREVQNVRRLINEGEDLERQLRGVFSQLRSLNQCTPHGKKCGLREVQAKCCKGLKCSDTLSGTCSIDCVPFGQSCAENFFCCSGHECKTSVDANGQNKYVCQ